MERISTKLIKVGNSKGVIIPKKIVRRYRCERRFAGY